MSSGVFYLSRRELGLERESMVVTPETGARPEGVDMEKTVEENMADKARSSSLEKIAVGRSIIIRRLDKKEISVTFSTDSQVVVETERKVIVLTCTDERNVISAVDKDGEALDNNVVYIRVPGGLHGLYKAIESVKQGLSIPALVEKFQAQNCVLANHHDNHDPSEPKCGCGYCGLCTLNTAQQVLGFDSEQSVPTIIDRYRGFAADVELGGGHVGGALVISLLKDQAIDPLKAKNAFFGLDLGLIKDLLDNTVLGLDDDQKKRVLVKLAYDNMVAAFVLTGGVVKDFQVLLSGETGRDEFLVVLVEEAHRQFKEKATDLQAMIEERVQGSSH